MRLILTFVLLFVSSLSYAMEAVPGEYIIRFKSMDSARSFMSNRSVRSLGKYETISKVIGPMVLLKSSNRSAVMSLRGNPHVAYMEPNYIYRVPAGMLPSDRMINSSRSRGLPNDSRFKELWGLHNDGSKGVKGVDVNALKAWRQTVGDKRIKIAVIDTGVDYKHPDLAANIWRNPKEIPGNGKDDDNNGYVDDVHGYDFSNNDGDPMDDHSHGTHCAGTIAAHTALSSWQDRSGIPARGSLARLRRHPPG